MIELANNLQDCPWAVVRILPQCQRCIVALAQILGCCCLFCTLTIFMDVFRQARHSLFFARTLDLDAFPQSDSEALFESSSVGNVQDAKSKTLSVSLAITACRS
jgi:hypothetical protein